MKFLKQYWPFLTIFLLVVCLVLIRTFSRDNFRYDAVRWAEASVPGLNLITEDKILKMGGDVLLVNLGNELPSVSLLQSKSVTVEPGLILEKGNLKAIRKNRGPVILFSDDSSVSARIWLLLSEMGIKNIYILQNDNDKVPIN